MTKQDTHMILFNLRRDVQSVYDKQVDKIIAHEWDPFETIAALKKMRDLVWDAWMEEVKE